MTVGCGEFTRKKWERFSYLLSVHAKMCRLIMKKDGRFSACYRYFDFFAGPGRYSASDHPGLGAEAGSPLRALDILKRELMDPGGVGANGENGGPIGFGTFFCEPEHKAFARLCNSVYRNGRSGGHLDEITCEEAVEQLIDITNWRSMTGCDPWMPLGLAFFDPNGRPPWESIRLFASARQFRRIDLLINVNSTVEKRCRRSSVHEGSLTPSQELGAISKRSIYLWEPDPRDCHQFALAYCTNGPFPEFRNLGFHRIGSEKGRRIADRIDLTREERRGRGGLPGWLFGMEDT